MARSQRLLRAIALGSVSYGVLLKMLGPMVDRDLARIINEAIYYRYRGLYEPSEYSLDWTRA